MIDIHHKNPIYLHDNIVFNTLGLLKSTWHIAANNMLGGGPKSKQDTLDGIIKDIHRLRFNPQEPYLISGDHFSVFYPRSLGIFYHTILDSRTALSEEDWKNRQKIYAQSLLYMLEVYKQSSRLSTTITPIGPKSVTLNNFFDPPSDTMYSILYALKSLQTAEELFRIYHIPEYRSRFSLSTGKISKNALRSYNDSIKRHLHQYITDVFDKNTGLVRTDKSFSGKKDSVIRYSSFYDNVILWKTLFLAQELGIDTEHDIPVDELKKRILSTFWLSDEGYFLEDLSEEGIKNKHYSSDWLIAFMTGFISPTNDHEREYFTKSIEFIKQKGLDKPFALKYQPDEQKSKLHWPLKLFAPAYGTQAIWSHWGMEYTKLLITLYQQTCDASYLEEAEQHIGAYKQNILSSKGYPEVYSSDGRMFSNLFYKSIRKTGWVVTFEQANLMLEETKKHKDIFCKKNRNNLINAIFLLIS